MKKKRFSQYLQWEKKVYQTEHLFDRLFPCPGWHLKARSNSSKFDVGPRTLNEEKKNQIDCCLQKKRNKTTISFGFYRTLTLQADEDRWEFEWSQMNRSFSNTKHERSWWKIIVQANISLDQAVSVRFFRVVRSIFGTPKKYRVNFVFLKKESPCRLWRNPVWSLGRAQPRMNFYFLNSIESEAKYF